MKAYLLQHLQRVCRCFKVRLNKPSRNLSKWFVKFFTILCIYDGMNHHQYLLSEEQDLSLFSPVHSSLPASQRQSPWTSQINFPMVSWTAKIQTVILERDFQHPQLRCSVMPTVPRQENVFLCHKTIQPLKIHEANWSTLLHLDLKKMVHFLVSQQVDLAWFSQHQIIYTKRLFSACGALTTWLGPLKTLSQAGRWDPQHIKIKNVVYSLCEVICPKVRNIGGWGAQKKKFTTIFFILISKYIESYFSRIYLSLLKSIT